MTHSRARTRHEIAGTAASTTNVHRLPAAPERVAAPATVYPDDVDADEDLDELDELDADAEDDARPTLDPYAALDAWRP